MRFPRGERVVGRQGDEQRLRRTHLGREPGVVQRRPHEADVDALPSLSASICSCGGISRARAPPPGAPAERCGPAR